MVALSCAIDFVVRLNAVSILLGFRGIAYL
jgi:hypothetical protein